MNDKKQIYRWLSSRLPKPEERTLVLLTGARQTGKTTLARSVYGALPYHNLDAMENRDALERVSSFGWAQTVGNAVLDEAQKLPSVFEKLKYAFDAGGVSFSVLLGSSQILLNRRVGESLAGRILIYELWPLMLSELLTVDGLALAPVVLERVLAAGSADAALAGLAECLPGEPDAARAKAEAHLLQWGGMPGLLHRPPQRWREWLRAYEVTYLERDLVDLARLHDLQPFRRFQQLAALRNARLLSYSELARDAGVSVESARRYFAYLRLSYQAFLLPPYRRNLTSRLMKTPKLYWVDIGLWRNMTGQVEGLPGELFEAYVIAECMKYIQSRNLPAALSFYRTRSGMEVDLLIEMQGRVLSLECKASEQVSPVDITAMRQVGAALGSEWMGGVVVYRGRTLRKMADRIWAVPSARLLSP